MIWLKWNYIYKWAITQLLKWDAASSHCVVGCHFVLNVKAIVQCMGQFQNWRFFLSSVKRYAWVTELSRSSFINITMGGCPVFTLLQVHRQLLKQMIIHCFLLVVDLACSHGFPLFLRRSQRIVCFKSRHAIWWRRFVCI